MVMQSSTLPSFRSSFSGHLDPVLDSGNGFADRPPDVRFIEQRPAPSLHGVDVRLLPHRLGRQLPHPGECRVEQLRAAIAAEHRNRLGEIVEGFTLDPDQAVIAPRSSRLSVTSSNR